MISNKKLIIKFDVGVDSFYTVDVIATSIDEYYYNAINGTMVKNYIEIKIAPFILLYVVNNLPAYFIPSL